MAYVSEFACIEGVGTFYWSMRDKTRLKIILPSIFSVSTVCAALIFSVAIGTCDVLSAAPSAREKHRIDALIAAVEKSGLVFIRNGSEYSAADAAAHMRLKFNNAGNRISTAEQFIDYLASKSSITGTPYFLKYPDGRTESAGVWLHRKLREIDGGDSVQDR